jgi:signal transduction histidine kinase
MSAPTVGELRGMDLFEELSDADLERWAAAAEVRKVAAGAIVVEQGAHADRFVLLLDGVIQAISVDDRGRPEPVGRHVAPTWMGAIPVLTEGDIGVRMQAETDVRVATIRAEPFVDLVLEYRPVHRRILRQVRPVMSRVTALAQNRERLAGLGKMAAGLAHELNNPTAAARRAASDLTETLDVLASVIGAFVDAGIERAEAVELVEMQREALARAADATPLSSLDAADAEDELLEALEDLGVPEAWRLAEPLAAAGVDREWLTRLQGLAGPATGAALGWIAASLTARGLASQLCESTDRMSRLVAAVKSYAYMDRGELVETDLHEGLETTLVVLGHKLKKTMIDVQRDYDRSLPKVIVRGPELNQVWTNLLDNAIAALGDKGTITVSTRRDGDCAVVEITDDGPGIPAEVLDRIFDPFFTTKGVGNGSGLGLDTARRIVEERHRGSLGVESQPGATAFSVRLPLEATAR